MHVCARECIGGEWGVGTELTSLTWRCCVPRLLRTNHDVNLIVTSYNTARQDVNELYAADRSWHYIVLDEGHLIQNPASARSVAIKSLTAQHRLVLTGTPVQVGHGCCPRRFRASRYVATQNHVLDLWSLFDFLMPGYLGDRARFKALTASIVNKARGAKASDAAHAQAAAALSALHRQVLPFVLRRLKSTVLKELPDKIVQVGLPMMLGRLAVLMVVLFARQDVFCDLTPPQLSLYKALTTSRKWADINAAVSAAAVRHGTTQSVRGSGGEGRPPSGMQHVFQSLHFLRQVCNHADLVGARGGRRRQTTTAKSARSRTEYDLERSAKLKVLRQLLLDCGIGVTGSRDHGASRSYAASIASTDDETSDAHSNGRGGEASGAGAGAGEGSAAGSWHDREHPSRAAMETAQAVSRSAVLSSMVSPHRVLIFAQVCVLVGVCARPQLWLSLMRAVTLQHATTLDVVEYGLLRSTMPSVRFLRLDGS